MEQHVWPDTAEVGETLLAGAEPISAMDAEPCGEYRERNQRERDEDEFHGWIPWLGCTHRRPGPPGGPHARTARSPRIAHVMRWRLVEIVLRHDPAAVLERERVGL